MADLYVSFNTKKTPTSTTDTTFPSRVQTGCGVSRRNFYFTALPARKHSWFRLLVRHLAASRRERDVFEGVKFSVGFEAISFCSPSARFQGLPKLPEGSFALRVGQLDPGGDLGAFRCQRIPVRRHCYEVQRAVQVGGECMAGAASGSDDRIGWDSLC